MSDTVTSKNLIDYMEILIMHERYPYKSRSAEVEKAKDFVKIFTQMACEAAAKVDEEPDVTYSKVSYIIELHKSAVEDDEWVYFFIKALKLKNETEQILEKLENIEKLKYKEKTAALIQEYFG